MKIPGIKSIINAFRKGFTVSRQPGQELRTFPWWSNAGIGIDHDKALTYSAYWACVRRLSETLASFPLFLMRTEGRGKEKAREQELFRLMHRSPNPEMPAFAFIETLMHHLVTWGNCYALIDWNDNLEPKALWIMRPDRTQTYRDPQTKQLLYKYTPLWGSRNGGLGDRDVGEIKIPAYRVLHIPGLGFDGLTGYSVVHMAKECIGLGLAEEEFGARYFGQGTNLGAVAKHPGHLTQDAHQSLKKDLQEKYEGLGKAHTLMLLEEGMTFDKLTIPPEDSQFLESRKFQIDEIARWFLIPPHMIGDLERATNNNIEQQSLEFVMHTMRPWCIRWEQWLDFKLMPPQLGPDHYFKFQINALLRGDTESRYKAYAVGIQNGWLSPDDVRELEDMNPLPPGQGGDIYMRQVNMAPAEGRPAEPQKQ